MMGWRRWKGIPALVVIVYTVVTVQATPAYERPRAFERVSLAWDGSETDRPALAVSMTPSTRYVAFCSEDNDLVPNDPNPVGFDAFVRVIRKGTTEIVSLTNSGLPAIPGGGTTGERVVFSLPLEKFGLTEGGELSRVEAFSAAGLSDQPLQIPKGQVLDRVVFDDRRRP